MTDVYWDEEGAESAGGTGEGGPDPSTVEGRQALLAQLADGDDALADMAREVLSISKERAAKAAQDAADLAVAEARVLLTF
jgi:hypothetical protein